MNGNYLSERLRSIVTEARFAQGLFWWLCLTNVTQLVQLYLYEGKSLPVEGSSARAKRSHGSSFFTKE